MSYIWKTKPSNKLLKFLKLLNYETEFPKDINHLDDLNRLNEIVSDKRLAKEHRKKKNRPTLRKTVYKTPLSGLMLNK
jgi:uncharacterized protein YihD (DUF1040 family)